jgi:hypothetical protein
LTGIEDSRTIATISDIPQVPAVYAMYGGRGSSRYAAYVGVAKNLRQRIIQHLINRDSSVATGTTAVGLHPDHVREVWWWADPPFADRATLLAAELVAFDTIEPALRSRGGIEQAAFQKYGEEEFKRSMTALFTSQPTGRLVLPTLQEALEKIADLEQRVRLLEAKLSGQ